MPTIKIISSTNGNVTSIKEYDVSDEQVKKVSELFAQMKLIKEEKIKKIAERAIIEDGFGSRWLKRCPECGRNGMQVMRPGKAQCKYCG